MDILWLIQTTFCMWNQLFACELNCWKVFGKKKKKEKLPFKTGCCHFPLELIGS